ncbi:MAG: serine/threonine-protein phosphatase [Clostridiales bacterium]|nr:serine/threonine-protein phosphatase [Clostridiales bacterium]
MKITLPNLKGAQKKDVKKRISENIKSEKFRFALGAIIYFLTALALSQSTVLATAAPFGVAFTAVSKKHNYIFSALGATLGYLLFCPEHFARYALAVLIAALGAMAGELAGARRSAVLPCFISFIALIATGIAENARLGVFLADYAITLGEGILGIGGAYFFSKTLALSPKRIKLRAIGTAESACIIISFSILLMSLTGLSVGGISPARIIAVLAILITLFYADEKAGVLLALCLGFVISFSGGDTLYLSGAYGFSALAAALFCTLGAFPAAAAFLLSDTLFCLAAGSTFALYTAAEALTAAIVFLLLPKALGEKIEAAVKGRRDSTPDGSLRKSLVVRLRFAAGAMNYISESVNEVREKISDINARKMAENAARLSSDEYITQEIINEKTNDIRRVAADQFYCVSGMLSDLAKEFDEAQKFDAAAAGQIRSFLGDAEIYPKNISVIEDCFGRFRVEILANQREVSIIDLKYKDDISRICARYFEKGKITQFGSQSIVAFSEKPCYSLEIGFAQHSAEGRLCGDTVKAVNDGRGKSILIISDGMGRGGRAALDGAMGAGLLSKLLSAGFGFDSALKVVNSALLVKSNEESLATLDCASIDMYTGRVDIYKAGAPASYIIKGNRVTKCELASMPAGILRGIEFAKRTAVLADGDIIILLSDGITETGTAWLSAFMTGFENMPAQDIADNILKEALKVARGTKEDDMSVIAARLNKKYE